MSEAAAASIGFLVAAGSMTVGVLVAYAVSLERRLTASRARYAELSASGGPPGEAGRQSAGRE